VSLAKIHGLKLVRGCISPVLSGLDG